MFVECLNYLQWSCIYYLGDHIKKLKRDILEWHQLNGEIRGLSPGSPKETLVLLPFIYKNTFLRTPESSWEVRCSSGAQDLRIATSKKIKRTFFLYSYYLVPKLDQFSTPTGEIENEMSFPRLFNAAWEISFCLASPRMLREFTYLANQGISENKKKGLRNYRNWCMDLSNQSKDPASQLAAQWTPAASLNITLQQCPIVLWKDHGGKVAPKYRKSW